MKNLHKAILITLIIGMLFVSLTFPLNNKYIQAAAVSADEPTQNSPAATEYKIYLPIVAKAPPPPVSIGPVGGSITAVLVDPLDQKMVYAGSYGGGVLKTIDGGNNWFESGTGMPGNSRIQSLGLIPSSRNIVFAGTNGDGLYRSVNYGDSWTKVGPAFSTNAVYDITSDPNRANVVYIVSRITTSECGGLRGAFYRSEDYGITWTLLRYGDIEGTCADYWYDVDVNPWDSNIVYLPYHEHGLYRSLNYAASFTSFNNGIAKVGSIIPARSMAFDTLSGRTYSGFAKGTTIYYSDNRGENWIPTGLADVEALEIFLGPLATNRQRVLVATLSHGVVYSDNNGASWNFTSLQNIQKMAYDVTVSNTNPQRWYAGTHGSGLFISTNNGASWIQAGTGIVASSIAGLTTSPQLPGEIIAAVYGQGILTTSDNGMNWQQLNEGLDSTNVTSVYNLDDQLYALADNGVYKFDGKIWNNLSMPAVAIPNLDAYLDYASGTFPIEKQLAGEILESNQKSLPNLQNAGLLPGNVPATKLALLNGQLNAGTAGDGLWVQDEGTWRQTGFKGQIISDIAFGKDGSKSLLAACVDMKQCSVYLNTGTGWTDTSKGLNGQMPEDLLIAPDGVSYLVGSSGIYRYHEATELWQNLLTTKTPMKTISSSIDGKWLIAAGEGAAWLSLDHGEHWKAIEGLNADLTYTSALFAEDGSVILGSNIGGAYKLELPKP